MKKFKQLSGFLLLCLVSLPSALMAQVQSSPGTKLVATGQLKLVFDDLALVNDGEFAPGNSTVIFRGATPSVIGGSNAVSFHDLVISKTGQDLSLDIDMRISGKLTLEQGNLQLNRRTLDLGYTGLIEGERNEARITSTSGGVVKANALLNSPRAVNPGNIGVEISSAATMGETVITRGHSTELTSDGQPVIQRFYDIKPQFNMNLRATLKFYYLDAELGNGSEDALTVFASKGDHWIEAGKNNSDLNTNFVVKNEIDQLHRFTLAGATGKSLAPTGKTSVQLFPNPTPGQFTVLLNSAEARVATLKLYDQLGRLLETRKINAHAGANNISWNIAKYANGTYYLSFDNIGLKSVKIVKD